MLPANVRARLRLPANSPEHVREDGNELSKVEGISNVGFRAGWAEGGADAGSYELLIDNPLPAS